MLKSKIHRATITDACIDYEGSITIDKNLMQAANLLPYEQVHVVNVNNGTRLETYVIEGSAGSGQICLNGAAARMGMKGDKIIILGYSLITEEDTLIHQPNLVYVDALNRITKVKNGVANQGLEV
ncbi:MULTISPECIES: aspartate 1-decarboxylase [Dehalococcoides]|jgi:aspartate 1-decarboxylase|uniref:Aspartate 1-decarboxylase n=3 Tax=Dehalococcoides TaxID=61434 RepID=PAND_DEHMC|nr:MULTISPECIES: aspartate 1-decarboxylase [Dehalococcoides]Q3ZXG1.1 RecName: Full=Aspartate 1-decarboxylase; AltName: Full=Aspartate alpha-decarboxylase; Contains: RecName: Full=Aspartate 1-decarboxylase beta chain; Contains: RecName: Full=Aspartate 1-decarboxylase alpha chain; Flags: Precursor [Dehalococcoides mccartyi CBDB1]AII60847.1 aspartate decarboxylase [Dehalococcoides mccartyi CG5]AQU05825.1 aspartate 1-decarboxylase [Dehalococcoides mccartyi]AQU07271.1 aspartate 1-decarboxylase [Deha